MSEAANETKLTKLSSNFENRLDRQSELKVKTSQLLRHNQTCVIAGIWKQIA